MFTYFTFMDFVFIVATIGGVGILWKQKDGEQKFLSLKDVEHNLFVLVVVLVVAVLGWETGKENAELKSHIVDNNRGQTEQ